MESTPFQVLSAWLTVAFVIAPIWVCSASVCVVEFTLTQSSVGFTGGLTTPVPVGLHINPDIQLGLSGALYMQFTTACPVNMSKSDTFTAALTLPEGVTPLTTQPSDVPGQVCIRIDPYERTCSCSLLVQWFLSNSSALNRSLEYSLWT